MRDLIIANPHIYVQRFVWVSWKAQAYLRAVWVSEGACAAERRLEQRMHIRAAEQIENDGLASERVERATHPWVARAGAVGAVVANAKGTNAGVDGAARGPHEGRADGAMEHQKAVVVHRAELAARQMR
eukprot:COSAG01_NODE_461_length_16698_cov_113.458160_12_plen_129_part_00